MAVEDVEMKDAKSPEETTEVEPEKKDVNILTLEDIREQAKQIEKSVSSKEPRFVLRVLRALPATRRRLNALVLKRLLHTSYTHSAQQRDALLAFVEEPSEPEEPTAAFRMRSNKAAQSPLLPEQDVYFHLLVLLRLLDANRHQEAVTCSQQLMSKLTGLNRRTLDLIAARCYFYYMRSYEATGQLDQIQGVLHARLRTATLRNDYEGQAVLINCLLRAYLHCSLYAQADKLVSKSTFPEPASNNEWARYLFYLGRIQAAQLDYSAAHKHLLQALRKAPQTAAVGFKQTVQKLAVTVELLMGDIPQRVTFRKPELRRPLAPYFQLTQAVRTGNIKLFNSTLQQYGDQFQRDHTLTLIYRLRTNVIKTAIRSLSVSYSRIGLEDVANKLLLDSADDAEFIVAKSIRDGVIEATVVHDAGFVRSKETVDIYSTREPQLAFHQRIKFCLNMHNQSVKDMRFPPKSYSKDLESAEERREREQQDLELVNEMAEEDEEDGFL